jgi:uncharacterized protein (DUF1697 family)
MARYIAFLRAINAGPGRTVKMDVLRQAFEALGFARVATVMATGNVVFETRRQNVKALERRLEARLREAVGYEAAVYIRTDAELAEIASFKPFPPSRLDAAGEHNVIFLAEAPGKTVRHKLKALTTAADEFRVHGREVYWLRRKKPGAADYSSIPLDTALGGRFTMRGMRTVKKIAEEYCQAVFLGPLRPAARRPLRPVG